MRSCIVLIGVLPLCACASSPPAEPVATQQRALYVAGDDEMSAKTLIRLDHQQPSDAVQQPSRLMRIYWFFGGR